MVKLLIKKKLKCIIKLYTLIKKPKYISSIVTLLNVITTIKINSHIHWIKSIAIMKEMGGGECESVGYK